VTDAMPNRPPVPPVVPARSPVPFPTATTRDAVAALNRTHDMAGLRARGGLVVRSIEARRRALVVRRVLRAGGGVVVDVGSEDGWIAAGYAAHVRETILVDLDPSMLARARARGLPRVRTLEADAAAPDVLAPASVDVVVLSAVLEHVPRPEAVLHAWAPALRVGGRFVVFVPADRPILAAKRLLRATGLHRLARGVSLDPAPGHVRTFTRRSLVRLLNPFGVLEEVEFDPAVLGYAATLRVA
jgi:SAM-dependent methyltransferase